MSRPRPPMPSGWNKTVADLVAALRRGERGPVSEDERFWGEQYERALVRASMPPGWNKTFGDLNAEMKLGERESVGPPEIRWAWEYERSLIPAHMRFPRKGDVYEALADMTARYMTAWKAPYTGGGEGLVEEGDRFLVHAEPSEPDPISVYVVPCEYEDVESRIVPASDRDHPKYGGFYLSFTTVELNERFRLVHEE